MDYPTSPNILVTNKRYRISMLVDDFGMNVRQFHALNPGYRNKQYLHKGSNFIVTNQPRSLKSVNGLFLSTTNQYKPLKLSTPQQSELPIYAQVSQKPDNFHDSNGNLVAIKVHRGMTISHFKRWFGLSKRDLEKYNAGLPHGLIAGQSIKVPADKILRKRYKVRNGDTLGKIAQRFRISIKRLKLSNGLRSSIIYKGQWLQVW